MRMLETMRRKSRICYSSCQVVLLCLFASISSHAQILTTLADFDGTNGNQPLGLIQGFDGKFYGTTLIGGPQNWGTTFRVTSSGILTTVYNFCSETNCSDGSWPEGRLTQATDGNFYGPADNNGSGGSGLIYEITPAGTFSVLHQFCLTDCSDGVIPTSVVQARNGNLYGTTFGSRNVTLPYLGTVFKLTPSGALTTLHTFTGMDGSYPFGPMMQASNGNFYGTTSAGGSSITCPSDGLAGCGTIFQITPSGTFATLHSFNGSDGSLPGYGGSLIEDADGNLYGTTTDGGNGVDWQCFGCGTIFKMSPKGIFVTLYYFCSQANCADGSSPVESLVLGGDGNFYGTTLSGGNSSNGGTIFKITPLGVLTTLYDFCSHPGCTDGTAPEAQLIQATDGDFYGTTTAGGSGNQGTIFRFSMGLSPFARLVFTFGKVGQADVILGQGFKGTTGVFFNGIPAKFAVVSNTIIKTTVPAGATTGFVTVQTPSGPLKSNVPFKVTP